MLKIILSMSLSGTFLMITLFLFRPFWKDRLSKHWQYYIWLVVLARLFIPFAPETNLMGIFFQYLEKNTVQTQEISWEPADFSIEPYPVFTNPAGESFLPDTTAKSIPVSVILFIIWMVTALFLFVRKVTIYQNFIHYVKIGQTPIEEIKWLNHFGKLLSDAKIKRKIELAVNPLISSPVLIGLYHPCIVLPQIPLSENDFYYTIRHEIIHYKRCDFLYKWVLQTALCLHWFNPFVYGMAREINRSCEFSCDEAVIFNMSIEEKKAYGDTLVNAMTGNESYKNPSAAVTLNEGVQLLKERLDAIMKFRKKSRITLLVTLFLTLLYCLEAVTIGAAAPNNSRESFKDPQITEKNGVYYIFCEDADQSSQPLSNVTEGSIKFVLVRKDSYTSIGEFSDLNQLTEQVTKQCETMMEKQYITPEESTLVLKAAQKIQSNQEINFPEKKTETAIAEEYAQWGIERIDNSYYYKEEPIRIFADLRPDFSPVIFSYNKKFGTIDIQLIRDKDGKIQAVEALTEDQADKIASSLLYEKEKEKYTNRTDSLIKNFEKYKPYGVLYDANQDAVYYHGNRVKLFVVFQSPADPDLSYSFELCYQDSNTDSTLYLEAVKDSSGNITEIRNLKEQIAKDLLGEIEDNGIKQSTKDKTADISEELQNLQKELEENLSWNQKNTNFQKQDDFSYVTMDGVQILQSYDIRAKDLTKEQADKNIKDWMAQCDSKKGAYILKTHSPNGYTIFLYYNAGGRYPWNISVNKENTIEINLYSNSNLATDDGYDLMYFTSPKEYTGIDLYLDHIKLDVTEKSL